MLKALARIFTGGRTKGLQPVGNTGNPWGSMAAGYPTSPEFALNLSGVAASVSLISGSIAALPAQVWKREADGKRVAADGTALAKIIANGSGGLTWPELIGNFVFDAVLQGNGLMKIVTSERGALSGLQWLPWSRITTRQLQDGSILYTWSKSDGTMEKLLSSEVIHLRDALDPSSPWLGRSRVSRSPGVISLANIVGLTAQAFNGNAAKPGAVIEYPQRVDDDTAQRLKNDLDASHTNQRSGKTLVLGGGGVFKPMPITSAENAQLVEQCRWSLEECARLFGINAVLIGDNSQSSYANSAQAARSLAVFTLSSWITLINAAVTKACLSAPYTFEIDLSELLKGDISEYVKSLMLMRNSATISANEARLQVGFDKHPSPEADALVAVQQGGAADNQPSQQDDPAGGKPGKKPGQPAKALNGAIPH